MIRFVFLVSVAVNISPAHAETYTYRCKAGGQALLLKIDDKRSELVWRGKIYKIKVEDSCAKFGWRAERTGESFDFCTATQGVAGFEERGSSVQCDQER